LGYFWDIFDHLKQGGQTAGHRKLRRLPKTRFKRDSDADQVIDEPLMALRQPFGPLEEHPLGLCLRTLFDLGLDLFNQGSRFRRVNFEG